MERKKKRRRREATTRIGKLGHRSIRSVLTSSRATKNHDLVGIAAEASGVVNHPPQRHALISEPKVCRRVLGRKEAKDTESICTKEGWEAKKERAMKGRRKQTTEIESCVQRVDRSAIEDMELEVEPHTDDAGGSVPAHAKQQQKNPPLHGSSWPKAKKRKRKKKGERVRRSQEGRDVHCGAKTMWPEVAVMFWEDTADPPMNPPPWM